MRRPCYVRRFAVAAAVTMIALTGGPAVAAEAPPPSPPGGVTTSAATAETTSPDPTATEPPASATPAPTPVAETPPPPTSPTTTPTEAPTAGGVQPADDLDGGTQNATDPNCTFYPQTGFSVCGAIRDKYNALGGPGGFMGYPTSNELTNPDGAGKRNTFQTGGSIYWSPNSPASQIGGSIFTKWGQLGYERGALGYPTTSELASDGGEGRQNYFQAGRLFWSASTGAHPLYNGPFLEYYKISPIGLPLADPVTTQFGKSQQFRNETLRTYGNFLVRGPTEATYLQVGGPNQIGLPEGPEAWISNGSYQTFAYGSSIYNKSSTRARQVGGLIRDKWATLNYERGALGWPSTNEQPTSDSRARFNDFDGGSIYWSPSTGARVVLQGIRDKWSDAGLSTGPFGLPTGDEYDYFGGKAQDFEGGRLTFASNAGEDIEDDSGPVTDGLGSDYVGPNGYERTPSTVGFPSPTRCAEEERSVGQGCGTLTNGAGNQAASATTGSLQLRADCDVKAALWKKERTYACLYANFKFDVETASGTGYIGGVVRQEIAMSSRSTKMVLRQELIVEVVSGPAQAGTVVHTEPLCRGIGCTVNVLDPIFNESVVPGAVIAGTYEFDAGSINPNTALSYAMNAPFLFNGPQFNTDYAIEAPIYNARCDNTPTAPGATGLASQGCVFSDREPVVNYVGITELAAFTRHVAAAQQSGLAGAKTLYATGPLTRTTSEAEKRANNYASCPYRVPPRVGGLSCDEYPFQSTRQGAALNPGPGRTFSFCNIGPEYQPQGTRSSTGYSICLINLRVNKVAGSLLSAFYQTNRVRNGDNYYVRADDGN